ncbi:MAG: hypothetical protein JO327_07920 [Nitrososphaeraceae archaeon]|nr:hypothetical protein [Nitrososphaeraceae archaeon]MBV9668042.1 hypothetical protein [Nitrososphaeraceae archaeon]
MGNFFSQGPSEYAALATEILLYDRLVIPLSSDNMERQQWKRRLGSRTS